MGQIVLYYLEDQIDGNGEVHHGDHNGSIVIHNTIYVGDTIRKLWLKFESFTTKTVSDEIGSTAKSV